MIQSSPLLGSPRRSCSVKRVAALRPVCMVPLLQLIEPLAATSPLLMLRSVVRLQSCRTFSWAMTDLMPWVDMQVGTEGDLLNSVSISTSGETIAFGGSGGYIHIWSRQDPPRVNLSSSPLVMPSINAEPSVLLREEDSFANAPTYSSQEVALSFCLALCLF